MHLCPLWKTSRPRSSRHRPRNAGRRNLRATTPSVARRKGAAKAGTYWRVCDGGGVCCSSDPCVRRLRAWFSGAPAARFSSLAKFRKPVSGRATLASQLRAISMPHARATALSAAEVAALEEVEHQSVGSFSDEDAPMPPTPVDAGAGAAAGAHASGGGSGASAWLRDLASAVVPGTWCVG